MKRTLTDAERIASIREVIQAANGDWHEATALWSIGADLNWLLDRAAADSAREGELRAALTSEDEIAHGEAVKEGPDGYVPLGRCAYCDGAWPCRTQRGINRLLARLSEKPEADR